MKTIIKASLAITACFMSFTIPISGPLSAQEINPISVEINNEFWQPQADAISAHDFITVAKFYHPDAILVSQGSGTTTPIEDTLTRWKKDADRLKAEGGEAGVSFRFTKRLDNEKTAYEEGIFNYYMVDRNGKYSGAPYHFSALLRKKDGQWIMLMENQIRPASQAEWDAAAKFGTVGTFKLMPLNK